MAGSIPALRELAFSWGRGGRRANNKLISNFRVVSVVQITKQGDVLWLEGVVEEVL